MSRIVDDLEINNVKLTKIEGEMIINTVNGMKNAEKVASIEFITNESPYKLIIYKKIGEWIPARVDHIRKERKDVSYCELCDFLHDNDKCYAFREEHLEKLFERIMNHKSVRLRMKFE